MYLTNWQLLVVLLPVQVQLHNDTYRYLIYERTATKRGVSVKTSPLYITHKSLFIENLSVCFTSQFLSSDMGLEARFLF